MVAFALAAGAAVEFTEATKPIDEVLRGAVLAAAGALICAVVSLGLLRRRRYGVVLQFLVEGLAAVLYLTMYSQPQTVDWGLLRKLIVLISYFFSTGTYFAKRWPFMASLRNPNSSAPAQETGETHSS